MNNQETAPFFCSLFAPPLTLGLHEMWSSTGKPVAPISLADSLHERRDLVARHPDHKMSGLKPWLSPVGIKVKI